jgi:hypothetical protein
MPERGASQLHTIPNSSLFTKDATFHRAIEHLASSRHDLSLAASKAILIREIEPSSDHWASDPKGARRGGEPAALPFVAFAAGRSLPTNISCTSFQVTAAHSGCLSGTSSLVSGCRHGDAPELLR